MTSLKIILTFFSHSPEFSPVSRCPNASLLQIGLQKYNCTPKFLLTFFVIPSKFLVFSLLFSTLTLTKLQLQLHNSPFRRQLQITFYNCRNFDQFHVKICPDMWVAGNKANLRTAACSAAEPAKIAVWDK